jgi:DNA polymerase-4
MSREETFGRDLSSDDDLEQELLRLVTRLATDLRARGLAAATVSVKLRDGDFRTRRASRTLDLPVISDRVIHETARELLHRLRKARRVPARLLGVALTSLSDEGEPRQMALFPSREPAIESARDRKLAETVDRVRERFGSNAVVPARLTGKGGGRRARDG